MQGNPEQRTIVHAFGDTQISDWHKAQALDDGEINSPFFEIISPMEAGVRDMIKRGYTKRVWNYFACSSCQLMRGEEPLVAGGDETISICPSCGCTESFVPKTMDIWDKPKTSGESQSLEGAGAGTVRPTSAPKETGDDHG